MVFVLYLLAFVNMFNMLHLGFYIVSANIYDIMKFRRGYQEERAVRSRYSPLVSVVIPAHNEQRGVIRTIESLLASTYKHIEIIVVENKSTDKTVRVVARYIRQSPQLDRATFVSRHNSRSRLTLRYVSGVINGVRLTLVSQQEQGKAAAVNNALWSHAHGKLLMCIDADCTIDPRAIERAVSYFRDRNIIGVGANVRVMDDGTFLGRLQRFEHMIGYRSKKFYALTNSEFIIGGVASTYRTDVLKKAGGYDTDTITEDIGMSIKLISKRGNRKQRIIYASDVAAMTGGVKTFKALLRQRYRWKLGSLQNLHKYRNLIAHADSRKYSRMLTLYRLPVAVLSEIILLLEPIVLASLIYLSFHYHTLAIFLGAYVTITLYVLMTVWPDEHLSVRQKFSLSLQSLQLYALFYAMDVVQFSAIVRCIIDYKKIIHRATGQNWETAAPGHGRV